MVIASLVFAISAVVVMLLEEKILAQVRGIPVSEVAAEHAVVPALRIGCIILFLLLAYPDLFGLRNPPPLGEVLFRSEGRLTTLLNVMFLAGLALPFVPGINRFTAVILPLQALLGATLMFAWTAEAVGAEPRLWLGFAPLLAMMTLAAGAHFGAVALSRLIYPDHRYRTTVIYDAALLLLQLPPILVYTLPMGAQLN